MITAEQKKEIVAKYGRFTRSSDRTFISKNR